VLNIVKPSNLDLKFVAFPFYGLNYLIYIFIFIQDVITADFCYGFLEFSPTLSLRLPGGISFDLMRYWDGQPVRFVCCERKEVAVDGEDPWGALFWCVAIEMGEDDGEEELGVEE
jgi:hypothetical protein